MRGNQGSDCEEELEVNGSTSSGRRGWGDGAWRDVERMEGSKRLMMLQELSAPLPAEARMWAKSVTWTDD